MDQRLSLECGNPPFQVLDREVEGRGEGPEPATGGGVELLIQVPFAKAEEGLFERSPLNTVLLLERCGAFLQHGDPIGLKVAIGPIHEGDQQSEEAPAIVPYRQYVAFEPTTLSVSPDNHFSERLLAPVDDLIESGARLLDKGEVGERMVPQPRIINPEKRSERGGVVENAERSVEKCDRERSLMHEGLEETGVPVPLRLRQDWFGGIHNDEPLDLSRTIPDWTRVFDKTCLPVHRIQADCCFRGRAPTEG